MEHLNGSQGSRLLLEATSKGGTRKWVRRCQRSLWRFATRGAGVGTRDNMPYRRHLLVAAASDVAWPASGPGYKRIAACMNRAARTRRGTPGIKSALSYYNRIMASSDPTPQKRPCRGDVTPRRSATRCSVNTYTVSYPTLLFAILFARGNNFFFLSNGMIDLGEN